MAILWVNSVRVLVDDEGIMSPTGSKVLHIQAARVRVNDEGVIDPNGTKVLAFLNARVPVDAENIWDGLGGGGLTDTCPNCGQLPPVQSSLTLSANNLTGEVGAAANVTFNSAFNPGNQYDAAPAITRYRLTVGGVSALDSAFIQQHIRQVTYTDAVINATSSVDYTATQGGVSGNRSRTSNQVQFRGFRRAFWFTATGAVAAPTNSAQIRAWLNQTGDISGSRTFQIPIPAGTRTISFAVPAALGSTVRLLQLNAEILGNLPAESHGFTRQSINVAGAGTGIAVPYHVFHMTVAAVAGWPNNDSYTVTIS